MNAPAQIAPRRTDADRAQALGPAEQGWETELGHARPTRVARLDADEQHGVPLGQTPWMKNKADLMGIIALAARFEHLTGVQVQVIEKILWTVMPDTLCYPSPDPRTLRRQRREWSVRRFAGEIGRHPRTWQKAVAELKRRGLLRVYDRNASCGLENGYEILLDAWVNLGRVLLGETAVRNEVSGPVPDARTPKVAGPAAPKWAVAYARSLGRTAEQFVALTMGTLQACLPELERAANERQLKDLGRRLMWLWRALGPEVELAEVMRVAKRMWTAANRSTHYLFAELRDDEKKRRLKQRWGENRLHDLRRAFSRRTVLSEMVEAAEDFHVWLGEGEDGEAAPALVPEGQAGVVDWAAEDVDTLWAVARATVAERLNPQDFGIWIAPLKPRAVEDGVLVLEVPNRYYRDWCEDNFTQVLSEAVGGPVGYALEAAPPGAGDSGVDPPLTG